MTPRFLPLLVLGVCLAATSVQARADQDDVQFFSNINVSEGSTVHDAVCFFCSVNIEGKATGDVVVFFGNTHISSESQHDVVNFFGNVTADDDASIGNNIVSFFGHVRLGSDVHVGEDLVSMFGALDTGPNLTVSGDRVVQPAIVFFGPVIFLAAIIILVVREYRSYRRRLFLRGYQFPPRM